MSEFDNSPSADANSGQPTAPPKPLNIRQRRILGVLMEKARTTPDAYPLSLNGLVTGCNQKSNRHPVMNLDAGRVEEELEAMRAAGLVAEIQGGSRVAKYRHFGYDYMGVKGAEAAVMIELLLRGEQTAGELRTRAGRFETIADLQTLQNLLDSLMARGLVVALTPAGRGQLWTHNLYMPEELERLRQSVGGGERSAASPSTAARPAAASASQPVSDESEEWRAAEIAELREEISDLRQLVEQLRDRLDRLES